MDKERFAKIKRIGYWFHLCWWLTWAGFYYLVFNRTDWTHPTMKKYFWYAFGVFFVIWAVMAYYLNKWWTHIDAYRKEFKKWPHYHYERMV